MKVTPPVNIHTHGGFSSAGPKAPLTVRKKKLYNSSERKAYISYTKEHLNSLHSYQASAKENTGNTGGCGLGEERGKGGEEGGVVRGNIVGGKHVEVMLM